MKLVKSFHTWALQKDCKHVCNANSSCIQTYFQIWNASMKILLFNNKLLICKQFYKHNIPEYSNFWIKKYCKFEMVIFSPAFYNFSLYFMQWLILELKFLSLSNHILNQPSVTPAITSASNLLSHQLSHPQPIFCNIRYHILSNLLSPQLSHPQPISCNIRYNIHNQSFDSYKGGLEVTYWGVQISEQIQQC